MCYTWGVKENANPNQEASMNAIHSAENPVVKTTTLRAYPGWIVRTYQDGTFDGAEVNGPGVTIGYRSFSDVVAQIRGRERSL